MKTSKIHTSAPLPFMGQKRRFLKKFREVLANNSPRATYVDLFGGSGLLANTVKSYYPDARVIYNDYDNFSERLQHIGATNSLLADLRKLVADLPRDKAIPSGRRRPIIDRIQHEEIARGYVDYITVSSNLLFAMNYAHDLDTLGRQTFYNNVRGSDYDAGGYLQGVERVRLDYKELFALYKDEPDVVFLVDPPYLSTDVVPYKSSYWKLGDYLDVLDVLQVPHYYYFTSNKSQIVELCAWMEKKVPGADPFRHSVVYSHVAQANPAATYTDIMIVK